MHYNQRPMWFVFGSTRPIILNIFQYFQKKIIKICFLHSFFQLAPPPTALQNFEYHWKHIKTFYEMNAVTPKIHIENTNLPMHLDDMLKLLIDEDREQCQIIAANEQNPIDTNKVRLNGPCLEFVLANRPFDLLTDIGLADSPPGASVCIINWMRRFLTCLERPKLSHKSILQPVQVGFSMKSACLSEKINNLPPHFT